MVSECNKVDDVVRIFELSIADFVVNWKESVAASELAEITFAVMSLSYVDALIARVDSV